MIHLYYGDGKGKTTAAIGLAVRAAGEGLPVFFVQFMKNAPVGEVLSLEKLGITIVRGKSGSHFFSQMTEEEKRETKKRGNENLTCVLASLYESTFAGERTGEEKGDLPRALLILDEICAAYQHDLIDRKAVDALIFNPPPLVELVLTGRNPPSLFLEKADYITEMKKIRHPYDAGLAARKGVEF